MSRDVGKAFADVLAPSPDSNILQETLSLETFWHENCQISRVTPAASIQNTGAGLRLNPGTNTRALYLPRPALRGVITAGRREKGLSEGVFMDGFHSGEREQRGSQRRGKSDGGGRRRRRQRGIPAHLFDSHLPRRVNVPAALRLRHGRPAAPPPPPPLSPLSSKLHREALSLHLALGSEAGSR